MDVNAYYRGEGETNKQTRLHFACKHGDAQIAQRLLATPGIDVDKQDKFGQTSLHLATLNASVEIVQLLLQHGANVGLCDRWGRTPLHFAVKEGRDDIFTVLLAAQPELDLREMQHLAAFWGQTNIVRLCLARDFGRNITRSMIKHAKGEDTRFLLESWLSIRVMLTILAARQQRPASKRCAITKLPVELLRVLHTYYTA